MVDMLKVMGFVSFIICWPVFLIDFDEALAGAEVIFVITVAVLAMTGLAGFVFGGGDALDAFFAPPAVGAILVISGNVSEPHWVATLGVVFVFAFWAAALLRKMLSVRRA